jgi:hypothetical protein
MDKRKYIFRTEFKVFMEKCRLFMKFDVLRVAMIQKSTKAKIKNDSIN